MPVSFSGCGACVWIVELCFGKTVPWGSDQAGQLASGRGPAKRIWSGQPRGAPGRSLRGSGGDAQMAETRAVRWGLTRCGLCSWTGLSGGVLSPIVRSAGPGRAGKEVPWGLQAQALAWWTPRSGDARVCWGQSGRVGGGRGHLQAALDSQGKPVGSKNRYGDRVGRTTSPQNTGLSMRQF